MKISQHKEVHNSVICKEIELKFDAVAAENRSLHILKAHETAQNIKFTVGLNWLQMLIPNIWSKSITLIRIIGFLLTNVVEMSGLGKTEGHWMCKKKKKHNPFL